METIVCSRCQMVIPKSVIFCGFCGKFVGYLNLIKRTFCWGTLLVVVIIFIAMKILIQ